MENSNGESNMVVKQDFGERAEEAALWVLERKDNPPTMTTVGNALRFEAHGLQFAYRPRGRYADDGPWANANTNNTNCPLTDCDEGLWVVATCPRHGGERQSGLIPTWPLDKLKQVGKFLGCTFCPKPARLVKPGHQRGDCYVLQINLCVNCGMRRFGIPRSSFWKKPYRYTEEEFREPTRRAIEEAKKWARDVECDKCVELVYYTSGGAGGTHASPKRTYRR